MHLNHIVEQIELTAHLIRGVDDIASRDSGLGTLEGMIAIAADRIDEHVAGLREHLPTAAAAPRPDELVASPPMHLVRSAEALAQSRQRLHGAVMAARSIDDHGERNAMITLLGELEAGLKEIADELQAQLLDNAWPAGSPVEGGRP